jgi:hypothetical protein
MTALSKGEVLDCSNPRLQFFAVQRGGGNETDGKLADLESLEFQIFDKRNPPNQETPKQIFPVTAGDKQAVNLADCPTGERLGVGRYAAKWTVAANEQRGLYEIRWTYKFANQAEKVARIEFEILQGASGAIGPKYGLVADLRAEGAGEVTDARLQTALVIASRFIERVTGRFFEARFSDIRFDGSGKRALLLGDPIIGLGQVHIETEPSLLPDLEVDPTLIRVYARHLSQGLLNPDDRNSPKIQFVHSDDILGVSRQAVFTPISGLSIRSLAFPVGRQNIAVNGVFGYTEDVHNGSPWGDTPILIRHLTKLIAAREIPKAISEADCRVEARDRWRVLEEKVRDQSIKYDKERRVGSWTGDPEIDFLLTSFIRPPAIGAV